MTLCQNSKIKYFGRLFLAFAMLLGGVFITNTSASAEIDSSIIDYYDFNNTGGKNATLSAKNNGNTYGGYCSDRWGAGRNSDNGNNSVGYFSPDCRPVMNFASSTNSNIDFNDDGGFTVCVWQKDSASFYWGTNNQHKINSMGLVYNFNGNFTPPTGSNGCSATSGNADIRDIGGEDNWNHYCISVSATSSKIYYNKNEIFSCVHNNVPNNNVLSDFSPEPNYYADAFFYDDLIAFNRPLSSSEIETVYNSSDYSTLSITAPASNDYVMYYGDNPVYTPVNTNYNLPVVYNVCDSWEDGKIILKLNNDNASSSEKLLTQCSGRLNFNSGAGSVEMSNTSYFTIENFRDDTILATSASFLSTVYKPLTAKDGYIVWNFPAYQYFDYTKTATTSLAFQYNVCSDANYSTSSKICIRNTSHPTNDPSNYCINLETCSGTGNIELPVFAQENSLTMNFSYYDKNNNYQLGSNEFFIVYYNGTYDTRAKWLVEAGEIACTPEEWASDNIFMNIKCGAFTSGVVIAQTLGNSAAAGVRILIRMLDGVFPFNLPIKIKQCWENSETKLLPSELNKINILDESGNVKINMPSEWAESGSITIWGNDVWNATNESNEFFVFIRNLSRYLIWGIFISIIYLWGKSLIEK